MDIHEHQAKELLKSYKIPTPIGKAVFSVEEALSAAKELPGPVYVVKAQIHAGGRGKAGGVKVVKDLDGVKSAALSILGKKLITHQTSNEGKLVQRLYIEDGCKIESEYYFSMVIDRVTSKISVIASTEGGMDIEKVADETPEKILSFTIDPTIGFQPFHSRLIANSLGLKGSSLKQSASFFNQLYKLFTELDSSLLEINPLVVTTDHQVIALDAKMTFDDNALFRHPKISELRDKSQEDPRESNAADRGLSYVGLDGNIGCIVNGAGLAMATMDTIKLSGGEPANFLDIGGGATPERVSKAFRLVRSDKKVEAILVNIFAGINRCDWVAEGVVQALKDDPINIPVIVRLSGTNVEEGQRILAKSGLPIIRAATLKEAADRAVSAWKADKPTITKLKAIS